MSTLIYRRIDGLQILAIGIRSLVSLGRINIMENSYSLHETTKDFQDFTGGKKFKTIYANPPWQFANRTGKVAPEHKRQIVIQR